MQVIFGPFSFALTNHICLLPPNIVTAVTITVLPCILLQSAYWMDDDDSDMCSCVGAKKMQHDFEVGILTFVR